MQEAQDGGEDVPAEEEQSESGQPQKLRMPGRRRQRVVSIDAERTVETDTDRLRNDLLDLLTQKYGVRAIVQYYPLYRYPLFQKKGCGAYDCPVLDAWWDNSFSFPWWCGIDDESMRIMCEGLIHAVKDLRG